MIVFQVFQLLQNNIFDLGRENWKNLYKEYIAGSLQKHIMQIGNVAF